MKTVLGTLLALALAVAACGGSEPDPSSIDEAQLRAAQRQACQPVLHAADQAGEAAEPAPVEGDLVCGNNGYCCNGSTGNVSKTSAAGCNGTWYATLAGCLTDPVCGSPSQNCYIN